MSSTVTIEETLPSSWYLDAAVFAVEKEQIFFSEWLCVAREEQVPEVADSLLLDVAGQSIILVRNGQAELRAFYNVCRHRGTLLCALERDESDALIPRGGVGGDGRIVCPYHAWSYDLDGNLLRAPHLSQEAGFQSGDYGLHQVALASWGGFVFLCLGEEPPSFAEHSSRVAAALRRYPLAELRTGRCIRYEVDANWKVLCENFNECYHCGPVHPELCNLVPAFRHGGGSELDWTRGIPHRDGADTFTFSGVSDRRAFPGLDAMEQVRHKGELLYPNLFLSLSKDYAVACILRPTAAAHTRIDCYFLFETRELERPGHDPGDAVDFWHLVNRQDWAICERVQQGMSSRAFEFGIFSPMEDWNLDVRRYVSDRIGHLVER